MTDNGLTFILAQAAGQQQGPPGLFSTPLIPMAIFMVAMYMVLIRPQQKKAKELAEQLKTLKRGDKIVTNGGIVGVVTSVKEKHITIRSDDAKLELLRTAVAEITERGNASPEVKEA